MRVMAVSSSSVAQAMMPMPKYCQRIFSLLLLNTKTMASLVGVIMRANQIRPQTAQSAMNANVSVSMRRPARKRFGLG